MPRRLACLLVGSLLLAHAAHSGGWSRQGDTDFRIEPDPPKLGEDITVIYSGMEESCEYKLDDDAPVAVDLSAKRRFVISKESLRGKRFITILADGGEEGRLVVRLPQS